MKPIIKICTPYYYELLELTGKTPIEKSIAELKTKAISAQTIEGLPGEASTKWLIETPDFFFSWQPVHSTCISDARNGAINYGTSRKAYQAKIGPFTEYLMTDCDIRFTYKNMVSTIDTMHRTGAAVVGAAYINRHIPNTYTAGLTGKDHVYKVDRYFSTDCKGTHPADFLGMGFALISADAVHRLRWPYFDRLGVWYVDNDGDEVSYSTQEDEGFCFKIRDEFGDMSILLDCDNVVEHCTDKIKIKMEITE